MIRRVANREGFVLAAAILAMVLVGAAVAAGYFIGSQEYRVGKSMREWLAAFYAAQSGLQREYGIWSVRDRWLMRGGDSVNVGPSYLPTGAAYWGVVKRVDNTPESDTDRERYYLIRMTGRVQAPVVGEDVRNVQAMLLRVRYYDFCCSAAITAKDHFDQAGSSVIDGNNNTPLPWAGQCDSVNTAPVPGIEVECDTCFEVGGAASSRAGNPPVEVDTALQSQTLTAWDEVTWDLLGSLRQKEYADGEIVTNTAPTVYTDPDTGQPACDTADRSNWGAPNDPGHPCFDYFPIIYADGNLAIQSSARGQGILLVEGDLTLKGGYEFFGIAVVKGHVLTEGTGGKVWGGVIVAGQNTGTLADSRLAGNAAVRYSACAIARAKRFAELARKEPIPLRAWVEALE